MTRQIPSGSLAVSFTSTMSDSGRTTSTRQDQMKGTVTLQLSNGTSDNQADRQYSEEKSIAASGTYDLDLAGAVEDALGETLTLAEIVGIFVRNKSAAVTTTVSVGAAASNPVASLFGDTSDVDVIPGNGGVWLRGSPADGGFAVAAGSADTLRFTNNDGSNGATIEIYIVGRSA